MIAITANANEDAFLFSMILMFCYYINCYSYCNYQNKECWIDMNVVGFYTSKYWQVERCDGSKNGIKLRKSSTEDSEQLTTIPLCTKFQSSDCRNGWARFTYGGKTGWLKLHYATPCGSSKGLSFSEDENNF